MAILYDNTLISKSNRKILAVLCLVDTTWAEKCLCVEDFWRAERKIAQEKTNFMAKMLQFTAKVPFLAVFRLFSGRTALQEYGNPI